jgi:hypothetical protein
VPLSGLAASSNYSVVVVAQSANGTQTLVAASKVTTPVATVAKVTPISPTVSNQVAAAVQNSNNVVSVKSNSAVALPVLANSTVSTISAATTSNGNALAVTITPPAEVKNTPAPTSYSVLVTNKTTGITTSQEVAYSPSTPASVVVPGLISGDNYAVSVIANQGTSANGTAPAEQNLISTAVITTPNAGAAKTTKSSTVVLTQTPRTVDAANGPQIVKVTPKVNTKSTSGNSATIDLSNLKPGQRVQVVLKGNGK